MTHTRSATLHPHPTAWLPAYLLINAVVSALPVLLNVTWPAATDARLFLTVALASQLTLALTVCCLPGWLLGSIRPLRALALPSVVTLTTLWWIALLIDARVFHQFGFHLNGLVIGLLLSGRLLQQLGVNTVSWLAAGAVLAGMATLQLLFARGLQRRGIAALPRARWLWLLLPLLPITQGLAVWYDAHSRVDAMTGLRPIPWLHTATARRQLAKLGWVQQDSMERQLAGQPSSTALQYPLQPLQCRPERPMNVLMIVVDSLRHDMLTPAQMPNASRFAAQAWHAEQHYSTGNNTMHGLFGLFYGLPALHTNTMIHHRRGPELLRQLDQHGYRFHLYGGASLQGARMDRAVFAQVTAPLHTAPNHVAQDLRDRHVVKQLSAALRQQPADTPYFGFMLLDSAHVPYAVPADAEHRFLPQARSGDHLKTHRGTDPAPLFNRYRNAVLKADTLIGQLLQALDDSGRRDDTVVIITSDHGESFNDLGQNDWGHNGNFSDVQTRVPMAIRWPGRAAAIEPGVTSHMDIAPTLLRHLLACSNPPSDHSAGLDLFGPLPPVRPLLVESWTQRAVRVGPRALLVRPYGVEVRDADYRPVADATSTAAVTAAIIDQMQLLQPTTTPSP